MAVTNTTNWRVRPSGATGNGGGFDPGATMATDLAATSATGASPVVTSASYNFVAGDVGAYVFVQAGTNWAAGWYKIASVASNAATLTASVGTVLLYPIAPSAASPTGALNTVAGCATTASPTGGTWSVDYSQQNAAQITYTDLVIDGTTNTKATSAAHPFGVNHPGNILNITSGSGFTVQHLTINSVTGTTATCNASLGTLSSTSGNGKLGGGKALPDNVSTLAQPGNTTFILGSAGNAASYPVASLDYTTTGFIALNGGDTTHGPTKWVADPLGPMPTLTSNGVYLYINAVNYVVIRGLYLTSSGTTSTPNGLIALNNTSDVEIISNIVNLQSRAGLMAIGVQASGATNVLIADNVLYGGSASPTLTTNSYLIYVPASVTYDFKVLGNTLLYSANDAINYTSNYGIIVRDNIIYGSAGNEITDATSNNQLGSTIEANTLDAGAGHGIAITGTAGIQYHIIANNIISNHTGGSKYGLTVSNGSTTLNDFRKKFCDYNDYYNNTLNYQNVSAGPHDLAVNPQYVSAGTDWTPGNTALKAVFPGAFRGTSTTNYGWMGAVQPNAAAGGGPTYFSY